MSKLFPGGSRMLYLSNLQDQIQFQTLS